MKYDFEVEKSVEKRPLTAKQQVIFDFIKKYIAQNNYAPTIREIGEGNNLSSSATVHTYINILIDKGWLKKSDYKFRTLEVVGENEYVKQANGIYTLPIINESESFKEQITNPTKTIDVLHEQISVNKDSFIIQVSKDDLFKKDEYLIIKKATKYKDTDYVVTLHSDKIKIEKNGSTVKNIIGKVISSIRMF